MWLAIITVLFLVVKVVLATLTPSARRRAELTGTRSSILPEADSHWAAIPTVHSYRPARAALVLERATRK